MIWLKVASAGVAKRNLFHIERARCELRSFGCNLAAIRECHLKYILQSVAFGLVTALVVFAVPLGWIQLGGPQSHDLKQLGALKSPDGLSSVA